MGIWNPEPGAQTGSGSEASINSDSRKKKPDTSGNKILI